MPNLVQELDIPRCPRCGVASPHMSTQQETNTQSANGGPLRFWRTYRCGSCAGIVLAESPEVAGAIIRMDPAPETVDDVIPERARAYLTQALDSLHAPSGAVMLAASAVDAMLKDKNFIEGSLYNRIDQAAEDHLITPQMALWAHEVRLDANDERHADENSELPESQDAERSVAFAQEFAEYLYVIPSRINRARGADS